jgi:T-complex protein 1 subunit delta
LKKVVGAEEIKKTTSILKMVQTTQPSRAQFTDKEKPAQVRSSNIIAAKGLFYFFKISSSRCRLCSNVSWSSRHGQNGIPLVFKNIKIQSGEGEVVISNDGATILKKMGVMHPAAKMVPFIY